MIEEIDSFVLDEACRQLAAWGSEDDLWDDFMISVNVSGHQLRDRGLVERVSAALERHRITPTRLCLDVSTEHVGPPLSESSGGRLVAEG